MDKNSLNSVLNSKPSRQEIEPVLNSKAEIMEVQQLMQTLELKFEDEFQSINEQLNRRASLEELQYMKRENTFKVDKEQFEEMRLELTQKVSQFQSRLQEKDQKLNQFISSLETKVDD